MKNEFLLSATLFLSLMISLSACTSSKVIYKSGEKITLQPGPKDGKDAYIEYWPNENYSNRNWANHEAITAVAWTAHGIPLTVRSMFQFNLTHINPRSVIKKATLSLYGISIRSLEGHSNLSGSNEFVFKRITSPWKENKVTWNTQPSVTDDDQVVVKAPTKPNENYTSIDVTGLVQKMISNPKTNYGFMMTLQNEEYYRRVVFASSDNVDPQKRPKLVIEF